MNNILLQKDRSNFIDLLRTVAIVLTLIIVLYASSEYNYLLFHSLAEIFSIIIGTTIFLIAWNTRKYAETHYFLFVGIAYLFVAGLDLIHTLAFPGMKIFGGDHFYANQFWIAARYMESISLLLAFAYINSPKKINTVLILTLYITAFVLIISSILWWKIFPECYIEGIGQTPFKIISEYIIVVILLFNVYFLHKHKSYFDQKVYSLLTLSFILTVLSELSFTLYISNYDRANLIGHILKIFSFYLIYKAVIEIGFSKPLSIFFRELKLSEEELKNLNMTKDKFFSIIAHDLKSPFNSLIGFSELLMNNYDSFTEEDRKKLFVLINTSSKKAHNLLDNLLQWSRTQTGALQTKPEKFNIIEVIQENVGLLEGAAKEKGIKLNIVKTHPIFVDADKNMISTVLRNLISNAIKFTYPDGLINIDVESDDDMIEVTIADTGVGMDEEFLENLFSIDKYKSTPGTANEKGSGLGLIICKEFIEKNEGRMVVKSEKGKGSEFSFFLPKANVITLVE